MYREHWNFNSVCSIVHKQSPKIALGDSVQTPLLQMMGESPSTVNEAQLQWNSSRFAELVHIKYHMAAFCC